MAIPSMAGIMPATPSAPAISFSRENAAVTGYTQADRLLRSQAEEARAREREQRLMWEFEQLREKAMSARLIDEAQRGAFTGAGATPPMPTSPAMPAAPSPSIPQPVDPSYTTAPVPDLTKNNFDPASFLAMLRQHENPSGDPNARPIGRDGRPLSSALGPMQFTEGTWRDTFPQINLPGQSTEGMSPEQIMDLRRDPDWSSAGALALADQNRAILRRALGREPDERELALAHFLGGGGAGKALTAAPGTPAGNVVGQEAVNANTRVLGGSIDDVLKKYGINVPNAPGAAGGMMSAPEPQARPVQTAQANSGTMNDASGVDLLRRYTNPAMQDYRSRLSQIPGGGAELMKSWNGEFTDRDKMGIQAFEYASKGQPDMARMIAQSAGLNVDPRIFANRDVSAKAFEVLKSMVGQDPAFVSRVMEKVLTGGSLAEAWSGAGTPKSWREQAGSRPGGSSAPFQLINRADGSLVRFNKQTGETETVVPPGRPEQARMRAESAARDAVKNGLIPADRYVPYMQLMERALLGDQEALQQLEGIVSPPKPPPAPGMFERLFGGQPAAPSAAPPIAPPPVTPQPPATQPLVPQQPQQPPEFSQGGAATYQPPPQRLRFDPATGNLLPVE